MNMGIQWRKDEKGILINFWISVFRFYVGLRSGVFRLEFPSRLGFWDDSYHPIFLFRSTHVRRRHGRASRCHQWSRRQPDLQSEVPVPLKKNLQVE